MLLTQQAQPYVCVIQGASVHVTHWLCPGGGSLPLSQCGALCELPAQAVALSHGVRAAADVRC